MVGIWRKVWGVCLVFWVGGGVIVRYGLWGDDLGFGEHDEGHCWIVLETGFGGGGHCWLRSDGIMGWWDDPFEDGG